MTMVTDNLGLGFQLTGTVMTGMEHLEERWCITCDHHMDSRVGSKRLLVET